MTHPHRHAIDAALVAGVPNRRVAKEYGVSEAAVRRYRADHLPQALAKAESAKEVTRADDLLAQVERLKGKAISLLLKAEAAGDYRTALAGIREARACLELLLEVEGEINRQPVVSLTLSVEWQETRSVLLEALKPFPTARLAVAERLTLLEAHNGHRN